MPCASYLGRCCRWPRGGGNLLSRHLVAGEHQYPKQKGPGKGSQPAVRAGGLWALQTQASPTWDPPSHPHTLEGGVRVTLFHTVHFGVTGLPVSERNRPAPSTSVKMTLHLRISKEPHLCYSSP